MLKFKTIIATALLGASLGLSSCATTPDPAKVCTSEWIKPRAARAIKGVKRDTYRTIKSLTRRAEKMTSGSALSGYQTMMMINSVQKLIKKLTNGRGVKDLRTLATTCNDPKIVRDSIASAMEDMQAPQILLDAIRNMDMSKTGPLPDETP